MNNRNIKALGYLLRADFAVLLKNRRSLLLGIILPLVILFSSKNAANVAGGAEFLVATCITLGLVYMAILGYALTVARDRDKGIFQRLRVTPAPTWTIMTSRLAVQVLANLIMAIVVLAAGSTLYHLSLGTAQLLLIIFASIVGAAVFLSIGQALVGLVRSADAVNGAARIVTIVLFMLGVFGRTGVLGTTMENVAKWSPFGVVTAIFSSAMQPAMWGHDTWLALVACVAYVIVFAGVGIKWFQWSSI